MERFFFKRDKNDGTARLLYEECNRFLYSTSLRILNNRMDAEEIMHDTIIKYLETKRDFESKENRNAWMRRVCINLSIDRLRKKQTMSGFLEGYDHPHNNIEEQDVDDGDFNYNGVTVDMVKKAMSYLPDGYRLILSLHLFEGMDYEEIAQITSLKEASIRSQYIRGKAKLLKDLNEKYK
ncbi:MAG: sigma-70 family RNA polymerase sigma factor [Bacteroidales bacterium]|nr:sigma-70 family RNA polymerase sigma factor [Bacteroidales bacterium]